jgi:hypothetical protein
MPRFAVAWQTWFSLSLIFGLNMLVGIGAIILAYKIKA